MLILAGICYTFNTHFIKVNLCTLYLNNFTLFLYVKSLAETMIRMNDDYCYKFDHLGLPWYIACCQSFIQGLSYWSSPMMRSHRLSQEWSFTSLSTISLLFSSCNPEKDDSSVVCCIQTIMASRRTDSLTSRYCHGVCVLCSYLVLCQSAGVASQRRRPSATVTRPDVCVLLDRPRESCTGHPMRGEHATAWTGHPVRFTYSVQVKILTSECLTQCNLCKALDQYGTLADYSRCETTFQNWFKCLKKARESGAENK